MQATALKVVKAARAFFAVRKDVPLPNGGTPRARYPFGEMEVGDMFEFPRNLGTISNETKRPTSKDKAIGRVSASACAYGRKHGLKFTVRAIDANTAGCWRIA